jgi:hypothetical protein
MLKLHSFKISDDAGMNELLSKSLIAGGSSVYVSNGELVIPIEDGAPITLSHRISRLKESRNTEINKIDNLAHTLKLSTRKIAELEEQIKTTEDLSKEGISHQEANERKLTLESLNKTLESFRSKHLLDESELARTKLEIEVYEETIAELEATNV